jgi:ADP-heptose:LPS heptosyltransferase
MMPLCMLVVPAQRDRSQRLRIPRVVGFRGNGGKWLINQTVPPMPPGRLGIRCHDFLRIAENCGARIDDVSIHDPLPPAQADGRRPTAPRSLTLCAGAEYGPAKRWPIEKFAEAALAVQEHAGSSGYFWARRSKEPLVRNSPNS